MPRALPIIVRGVAVCINALRRRRRARCRGRTARRRNERWLCARLWRWQTLAQAAHIVRGEIIVVVHATPAFLEILTVPRALPIIVRGVAVCINALRRRWCARCR